MAGTLVTLSILQAVVVPLTALFFAVAPAAPLWFALVCLLGTSTSTST